MNLLFLLFHPCKDSLIAVGSVNEAFVDPADCRSGCLRNPFNFIVSLVLREEFGYLQSLRYGMYLVNRADTLEKPVAVFFTLKEQHRLKQFVNVVPFEF